MVQTARMKYSCIILAECLLANNNMSVSILLESPLNPQEAVAFRSSASYSH